jgi:hypothetical protein
VYISIFVGLGPGLGLGLGLGLADGPDGGILRAEEWPVGGGNE